MAFDPTTSDAYGSCAQAVPLDPLEFKQRQVFSLAREMLMNSVRAGVRPLSAAKDVLPAAELFLAEARDRFAAEEHEADPDHPADPGHLVVSFSWNVEELGEGWFNMDNLRAMLYGGTSTSEKLLRIAAVPFRGPA